MEVKITGDSKKIAVTERAEVAEKGPAISKEMAERFTGNEETVLVEEKNSQMDGYVTGRLGNNHVVHFEGSEELIGKLIRVRLDECRGFYYMGTMLDK